MFVDASALVSILNDEEDAPKLADRLDQAEVVLSSPIAVFECVAAITRLWEIALEDAERAVDLFIEETGIQIVEIDDEIGRVAIQAFARYGKGRHRASLNLGDCFAYACAKHFDLPLLFKGNDFGKTDITKA